MGKNIRIEEIKDGNIEQCRELCNELMAFQKSQAKMAPEAFDLMNFDTRMRASFESTPDSQVIVVKDNGMPVGYVFSDIEDVNYGDKSNIPDWISGHISPGVEVHGFYPDWDELPKRCGCLNNLYLRGEYRGQGIAARLFDMTMEWIKGFPDVDTVFVYISNGNDAAMRFYEKHGFTYSHDVFGGFIKAAYYKFDKTGKDN